MSDVFAYDAWPSRAHLPWGPDCERGENPYDQIDFHVDLGCGTRPKARIGVDRFPAPGVAVVANLDPIRVHALPPEPGRPGWEPGPDGDMLFHVPPGLHKTPFRYLHGMQFYDIGHGALPFDTSSIKSIVSHHFFEHVGEGFVRLVDEIYRVLEPGGILRAITPLFPSTSAVEDPDHCRYFMAHPDAGGTWDAFCGSPDTPHWTESFSVPYTRARFKKVDQDLTQRVASELWWTPHDVRELRVALQAMK